MVMLWSRLGSLNALEQTGKSRFWNRWLGGDMASADTVGRVCQQVDADTIRSINHEVYRRLKRIKALCPPAHGLMVAVLEANTRWQCSKTNVGISCKMPKGCVPRAHRS